MKIIMATLCLLISTSVFAKSHHHHAHRYDTPISVMGDHVHEQGDWMVSYRYMKMKMNTLRSGSSEIGEADVLANHNVSPREMDMEMHMVSLMYAPTKKLTVMAMMPHVRKSMEHINGANGTFTAVTDGPGDLKLTGTYLLKEWDHRQLLLNAGLSVPTGSIDEKRGGAQLAYAMQLGSGTYDLLPGITYVGEGEDYSWGTQLQGVVRAEGSNDNDYRLGNEIEWNNWYAYHLSEKLSSSLRLSWKAWEAIEGADPGLNPAMVSTARTSNYGGERIDLGLGLSYELREHKRLALEIVFPLYEDLNGQQLGTDWQLHAGLQVQF